MRAVVKIPQLNKSLQNKLPGLDAGFAKEWKKKVGQLQAPIFARNTKGAWTVRIDDVLSSALEEGPLRTEEEFFPHLEDNEEILIVTEGKTDTFIIKTAIDLLYPAVADFFCFIDMKENYPFTGTGNLYNFASGLTKIKIQNKTIIVFDNDEAGTSSYKKCIENLDELSNLKFYHLPIMPDFNHFSTIGPSGESIQDINGKAVSIECFLDLSYRKELRGSDGPIMMEIAINTKAL
ncbi:MAG: hypothetical protein IJL41_05235 [Clostridia bacterium]|nr:hypothetical protein [Clostridia bacterium]